MAYICYKPAGSCETCEHMRWDYDEDEWACFAQQDEQRELEALRNTQPFL